MKHEYEHKVTFRRKHAIKGDTIKVTHIPPIDLVEGERAAIEQAIKGEYDWDVYDGDVNGALIQLPDVHDLTWLPTSCFERTA